MLQPDHVGGLFNLGGALVAVGNLLEAERCFRQVTELCPDHSVALDNLGLLLEQGGRPDAALACYEKAVAGSAVAAIHHRHLGLCYLKKRRLKEAEQQFRQGLSLDSTDPKAFIELGRVQTELGDIDAAVASFNTALTINPELDYARFWLSAINDSHDTDAAKHRFVTRLFDGHAEDFDRILVKDLAYRTPWLIADLVTKYLPEPRRLDILDLGCGTGLCADSLYTVAGTMIGVDLSSEMLKRAAQRNRYTKLLQGDIVQVMESQERQFDLIVAADVFVYVGGLEAVFEESRRLMRDGALFVFSAEVSGQENGYMIRATGRYAHSSIYIEELATRFGFKILHRQACMLRKEAGQPITGNLFLLRK
jgi:predicted TPR repeat methyltransferase